MLTLAMTAGNDNDVIWIIKVTTDNYTYRFATESITLSSNLYDGAVVFKESFSDVEKTVNMTGGGSLGQVGNFSFAIVRYASNSLVDGFFNEFYPKTSGEYLSGRLIEVGVVWRNATAESEITWLEQHVIYSYVYDPNRIFIDCIEIAEIEALELPYYSIQKDLDNGISYFLYAPEDNYGQTIPSVYGSFNTLQYYTGDFALSPCLLVHKSKSQFIIASHPVKTTSYEFYESGEYSLFKYVDGLESYLTLYNEGGTTSATNTITHTITFQETLGQILGEIDIALQEISRYSDVEDIDNALDGSEVTYVEIPGGGTNKLALRVSKNATTGDVGVLTPGAGAGSSAVSITFRISSNDVNSRSYTVNYRNFSLSSPANGDGDTDTVTGTTIVGARFNFNDSTTAKKDTVLPWTFEEILNLDYFIQNNDVDVADVIRVYHAYVHVGAIIVSKIDEKRYNVRDIRNA